MTPQEAWDEIERLLSSTQDGLEAKDFLVNYHLYAHAIDDIIDEKITEPEKVLTTHILALNLYSSNFYKKYGDRIYPIIRTIHHTYLDSCALESSSELWKKETGDVLRGIAIEMTLTICEIFGGYEFRRKISIAIREDNYLKHHDENGNAH